MVLIKNDGTLPLDAELAEPGRRDRAERGDGPNPRRRKRDRLPALCGVARSRDCGRLSVKRSEIVHAVGVRSSERTEIASSDLLQLPDGSGPGVEVIFFDAEDRELGRQQRQAGGMMWWGPVRMT